MRVGKSVKNTERSALMSGLSTTSTNRSNLHTLDSGQMTKYRGTHSGHDEPTAGRCWSPDLNRRRPPPSVCVCQKDSGVVKLNALLGKLANCSQYSNAALLSDAENIFLLTKK